jgi:hypothetical protein
MHLVTSCLLAWWLGWPDWFKADILCVSHIDKINTLMIINSIFIILLLPLVLPWWHFSLYSPFCAGDKKNEEEKKKDLMIKIV